MAVPQVSKMITDRQRQCEFADRFVVNHHDALVAALDRVFRQDLEEGHPETGALPYVDSLVRRLRRAFADLVAAEERHLAELADDGVYRDRRDESARALRDVLFDFRRMFRSAFGDRKAEEAGFERRIAQHPLALLRQTGRIVKKLRDPAFELSASRYEGVAVAREKVAEHLETPARQLRRAVDDLTNEQTKAHGTKVAKDPCPPSRARAVRARPQPHCLPPMKAVRRPRRPRTAAHEGDFGRRLPSPGTRPK